jgi:hypothetical protein
MRLRVYLAVLLAGGLLAGCAKPPAPPTIQSFTADPTLVAPGSSVTLSWKTTGADSVSIDQGVGAVSPAAAGSKTVTVSVPTTYTLTTKNAGGSATATVTVTVIEAVKGHVYQTIASGGQPLPGAKVTARLGSASQSATTNADGSFQVSLPTTTTNPNTFSLTVEPPSGSVYQAITYDTVPLADYASPYGAANEMNIYLGGGAGVNLPGYTARFGCVTGKLFDTDGTTPVVAAPPSGAPDRASPTACDGSTPPGLFNQDPTLLSFGENGLVMLAGFRVVTTRSEGTYRIPVRTTDNNWAVSGNLWAGNYNGDASTTATLAHFWSKYVNLPNVSFFTNGTEITQNLTLKAFDPATNPEVINLPVSYDFTALTPSGFDFSATGNALALSNPFFVPAITSSDVPLGEYADLAGSGGPIPMRVIKIGSATPKAQQIRVESQALKLNNSGTAVLALSNAWYWRDGTNQSTAVNAQFLGVAQPSTPADASTGASKTPTLSWKPVSGGKVYGVTLTEASSGKTVWTGFTTNTNITVPVALSANKTYLWDVYTNDHNEMLDYIGLDPDAFQAGLWVNPARLAGLKGPIQGGSRINAWRGELVKAYLEATGKAPHGLMVREQDKSYQNLLTRGYRESIGESFSFTTAP